MFFPLNEILAMLVVGISIVHREPRPSTIQWSRDLQTIHHLQLADQGLRLTQLRAWVQWVIQSTTTMLERDLLLGY
jgi:hypothetical protein